MTIQSVTTANEIQTIVKDWKADGFKVGFVPTMGALHEGHLSLIRLALKHTDRCVVSIFVNPAQFAPHEDFDSYPRDMQADLIKLEREGVHAVYKPSEAEIYPNGQESTIKAGAAGQGLETDFRPHFFDGVVNVVYRLFEQVQSTIAVFGEKDFQQLQVIKEMVETHNIPVEILGEPIARDEHGLALSSRNQYLNAEELEIARQLNTILKTSDTPEKDLLAAGFDKIDYVSERWDRRLAAVWIGKTRLIDNVASSQTK